MRGAEQCWHRMAERDDYSDGVCRACVPPCSRPSHHLSSPEECPTLCGEPLQFIVIIVMGVIGGTFPHTYRGFYMTVN